MPQSPATTGPYIARTAEDLAQMMLDHLAMMGTPITDFTEGSVTRTEIEALAQLGQQFYADNATQLQDAIAQSAYQAFNFTPLPPVAASGYLVFHVTTALPQAQTFVAGTLWQPTGQSTTYATTTTFTIPGATTGYWHVPSSCLTLGASGNLAAGATGNLQYPVAGITVYADDGAVNGGDVVVPSGSTPLKKGFVGGRDNETPLEVHTRFTSFLSSLHRSTLDSLQYGASTALLTNPDGTTAEQVVLARGVDNSVDATLVPTTGVANVYIFNGIGSPGGLLTSAALVAAAQSIINGTTSQGTFVPGYKAAGIPTTVYAAGEYLASLSVTVTAVGSGTATAVPTPFLSAAVTQAIQTFFANYHIGDKFYLSALTTAIGAVQGVQATSVTALTIVRQSDAVTMTATVGDYTTPTNGILVLATGQPVVTVA